MELTQGFPSVQYACPEDAVPRGVFSTPQRWSPEFGFTATARFTHMQWRRGPAYLLIHHRFDLYAILSSTGHCGLARIRKYKVESMLDAFDGEWLIPWGLRPAFRADAENTVDLVLLDGRIDVRLNRAAIGNCADNPNNSDALVKLLVCGNREAESVALSGLGYFDPVAAVPFEGAPCWLEVEIEDRLNTESGAPSAPAKRTVYWLVPLDWANSVGRDARIRRLVEKQYRGLNAEASAQRVRYTVLNIRSSIVQDGDIPEHVERWLLESDGTTLPWRRP